MNNNKEYIKEQIENYLKDKGINNIKKQFRCLNPDHEDKHPSMSYDRKRKKVHCFSCRADYDIFDLIGIDYGLEGGEKFKKAEELFNLDSKEKNKMYQKKAKTERYTNTEKKLQDNTKYYKESHERMNKTDYLQNRGISKEAIDKFNIGFDPQFKTYDQEAKKNVVWKAIIIPINNFAYVARNTDVKATEKNRYRKVAESSIFNKETLQKAEKPIFVTEGEIDALSIITAGGEAIALGSVSNIGKFLEIIGELKPVQPLIISLDSDEEGERAKTDLEGKLKELKICFYSPDSSTNIYGKCKDANGLLVSDKKSLITLVEELERAAKERLGAELEEAKERFDEMRADKLLEGFIDKIKEKTAYAPIPTGFVSLDNILEGGIYKGLYIIGAVSAVGKTTFVLQLADQIAQGGKDVLIFSLEMDKLELVAKSISRHTYLNREREKTTRGILDGKRYEKYIKEDIESISNAIEDYKKYSKHIIIREGLGDIGTKEIKGVVEEYKQAYETAPIIIIDYLQILAPYELRATDKQNTDKAVLELKRMSRDYDTPVIAISSFNRENYNAPVNLASFKESGAIEYSSDVLIGIQYKGMDYEDGENDAKRKLRLSENNKTRLERKVIDPIEMQLKVLKNRHGGRGEVEINLYPAYNYFEDLGMGVKKEC